MFIPWVGAIYTASGRYRSSKRVPQDCLVNAALVPKGRASSGLITGERFSHTCADHGRLVTGIAFSHTFLMGAEAAATVMGSMVFMTILLVCLFLCRRMGTDSY